MSSAENTSELTQRIFKELYLDSNPAEVGVNQNVLVKKRILQHPPVSPSNAGAFYPIRQAEETVRYSELLRGLLKKLEHFLEDSRLKKARFH